MACCPLHSCLPWINAVQKQQQPSSSHKMAVRYGRTILSCCNAIFSHFSHVAHQIASQQTCQKLLFATWQKCSMMQKKLIRAATDSCLPFSSWPKRVVLAFVFKKIDANKNDGRRGFMVWLKLKEAPALQGVVCCTRLKIALRAPKMPITRLTQCCMAV